MSQREVVRYEQLGAIAVVTICRPEAANALDPVALGGLRDALDRFATDAGAEVLIISGEGDRAFCAGADLEAIAAGWVPTLAEWPMLGRNVHLDKPVVAAVNGVAAGGGFNLAASCDLCLAAEHARFAITEARWGRGMDWAALLPRTVPTRIATEMMLTARPIDAARAQAIGLVNQVVPGPDLREAALELAGVIAANSAPSVRAAKALVQRSVAGDADALFADATTIFEPVYRDERATAGPRSFVAQRRARAAGSAGGRSTHPTPEPEATDG